MSGDAALDLALKIDETVKRVRPDGWRGHPGRASTSSRRHCYRLLQNDVAEVERIFLIIKAQREY